MLSYRDIVAKASIRWMSDVDPIELQLFAQGIAQSDMKVIVEKLFRFNYTASESKTKTESLMTPMCESGLPAPDGAWELFTIEVLGVAVTVYPIVTNDDPSSDMYLDISWRCPNTKEDCIIDGEIVDKFVDAIGIHNCKRIIFCAGPFDLLSAEESIVYADMFVVLHEK